MKKSLYRIDKSNSAAAAAADSADAAATATAAAAAAVIVLTELCFYCGNLKLARFRDWPATQKGIIAKSLGSSALDFQDGKHTQRTLRSQSATSLESLQVDIRSPVAWLDAMGSVWKCRQLESTPDASDLRCSRFADPELH